MGETDIKQAVASNLTSAMTDYSVDTAQTDGATALNETTWTNTNWPQQLGYYKKIPELQAAINAKATWTVGKGLKTDPQTQFALDKIAGWGRDTFNTILENLIRTYHIGGDSYAEIIRDDDGELINLKPLDPGVVSIIANKEGRIKRYEQSSKTKGSVPTKFKKEEMFHLAKNRVADEIHGTSIIDAVETIILMRNEAMDDWKKVLHRNVYPQILWHLDTDDPTQIAKFKATNDAANADRENIYIPKGAVEREVAGVPPNATLNPQQWIGSLNQNFFQAVGVPQIIVGGSQEFTEATAKIAYLVFQQNVEEEQLFIEEQIGMQLGIKIELEFPVSLENDLMSDKKKDGAMNVQPNETTAGAGQ